MLTPWPPAPPSLASQAPLVGTLMEVLQAVRFADGRLLVLGVGVGRFRVARPTQSLPYWRADVELLADTEETQHFEGLAVQALDSVRGGLAGGGALPLGEAMAAVPAAARGAAAAWAAAWAEYELSDARQELGDSSGVIDGTLPEQAQRMGRRLAAIGGNEVLAAPFWDALANAAQAASAPGMQALLESGDDAGSILQAALDAQRPVLRQTEASAYAQATSAAAAAVEQQLQQPGGEGGGGGAAAAQAAAAAGRLNTVAERGLELQPPAEILGDGGRGSSCCWLLVACMAAACWIASNQRRRLNRLNPSSCSFNPSLVQTRWRVSQTAWSWHCGWRRPSGRTLTPSRPWPASCGSAPAPCPPACSACGRCRGQGSPAAAAAARQSCGRGRTPTGPRCGGCSA